MHKKRPHLLAITWLLCSAGLLALQGCTKDESGAVDAAVSVPHEEIRESAAPDPEIAEQSASAAGEPDAATATPGEVGDVGDVGDAGGFFGSSTPGFIKNWTGDLDGMAERRVVRLLTVYGSSRFFIVDGKPSGLMVEAAKAFENYLNKKYERGLLKINVVVIPVARDQLIPALLAGRGDVAAAELTITSARESEVAFSIPTSKPLTEILVTGPAAPAIQAIDDLAGKTLYVRQSSSYRESIEALNKRLASEGKGVVRIKLMPDSLEDDDLVEMVNDGLLPWAVVDDYKIPMWTSAFENLRPRADIAFREGGRLGWAMRKDSPKLKAAADAFLKENRQGTLLGNMLVNRYVRNFDLAGNALAEEDFARFQRLEATFKEHSDHYGVPYLFAVAQGYQESRLDQSAKSAAGAIGIMQLLSSTANDKAVGIPDIHVEEKNIEAGIKYLVYLRDRYFSDPAINDIDKMLFSLAAYNAGPARVRQLRSKAEQDGYDPNIWFDNVEVTTARVVGRETVSYVTNIYRYYLTYGMVAAKELERQDARSNVGM